MLVTVVSSFLVFTFFFAALLRYRYALARLADARAHLAAERDDA